MILVLFNGMDCLLAYYMAGKGSSLEKKRATLPLQTQLAQNPTTKSPINYVRTAEAPAVAKAMAP
jgi:hypothetical protein